MSESIRTIIYQKCGGVAANLSLLHQWAAVPLWANLMSRMYSGKVVNQATQTDQFACYITNI